MAILQIIDQLDVLVENSRRVPMSSLRMIDYAQTKQAIERPVSYTHLRAHETVLDLVCRLLLETKKNNTI